MVVVEVILLVGDEVAEVGAEVIVEVEIDVDVVLELEKKKKFQLIKVVGSE